MDAWRTPERILAAHLSDQRANAGRCGRSAGPPPGLPAPEQAEAAAVPAHQRLRFEDHRGLEQGREQAVKADEDQPVGAPQPDPPRRRSLQDEELLPPSALPVITAVLCGKSPGLGYAPIWLPPPVMRRVLARKVK
jgi:hypothetical protein